MIVADTDVLIDFLEGTGAAERVREELARDVLMTTTVTRYELLAGARSRAQKRAVREILGFIVALPLDAESSDRAAAVWQQLESAGERIGTADCLIAGVALEHEAALLTRNRRHFARVADLRLV